ncbi:hypothetical protein HN011_008349, partial [Eciton burchellii]
FLRNPYASVSEFVPSVVEAGIPRLARFRRRASIREHQAHPVILVIIGICIVHNHHVAWDDVSSFNRNWRRCCESRSRSFEFASREARDASGVEKRKGKGIEGQEKKTSSDIRVADAASSH